MCDNNFEIEDPKIVITSDMEQKHLQLTRDFKLGECFSAVERIRAQDPNSIKAELLSFEHGGQIDAMEQNIEELKARSEQLHIELQELRENKFPEHRGRHIEDLREKSDQLRAVQNELQSRTAEYYQLMNWHHPERGEDGKFVIAPRGTNIP